MRNAILALALTVTLFGTVSAVARQVAHWPYERCFKEAELVVIAKAETTVEANDQLSDEKLKGLIPQNTTFTVQTVIKGDPVERIAVLHLKHPENTATQNGPSLVRFRTKPLRMQGGGVEKFAMIHSPPEYLLFLRKLPDGRFEAVSGQYDPALSVREIYRPLPDMLKEE